jgi:hypothetical protein
MFMIQPGAALYCCIGDVVHAACRACPAHAADKQAQGDKLRCSVCLAQTRAFCIRGRDGLRGVVHGVAGA